jgi:hypothetical protein
MHMTVFATVFMRHNVDIGESLRTAGFLTRATRVAAVVVVVVV